MPICVFEDRGVQTLEPLSLTRPAFDLRCGASTLLQRQRRAFGALETGALVRPVLAEVCRANHPEVAVNDLAWLRRAVPALVNARWLPPPEPIDDLQTPRVALAGDQVAYVVLPPQGIAELAPEALDEQQQTWKDTLPRTEAGGVVVRYLWELVGHNARALAEDLAWFRGLPDVRLAPQLTILGPAEQVAVHKEAAVEPFVLLDARGGPVLIDRGAIVQAFSRVEGPCYVGPDTWVVGGKVRGSTLGPQCRVGGEVEASIVQGHSNKYHDGFLGHSYLGEWVNLAAGTHTSDLRNDYGPVSVVVNGQGVATGLTKVGSFVGDHTKTGLNTLLNTGSTVGAFCNLLPAETFLPRVIPSFCGCARGQLQERWDLRQLFATAEVAMRRRGRELTDAQRDLVFALYEQTAEYRREVIRESEQRRLRRSV
jgi:UDP-N-acetylglucosamine diphosphorylase/glucosamine-1-phosphate N-acetyltransferase